MAAWALNSPTAFGSAMIAILFGLKILALPLLNAIDGDGTTAPVVKMGVGMVCCGFVALPIETAVGQWLPIWALQKVGVSKWPALVLISAIFFGLIHAPGGADDGVVGFLGGLVLSYCWLCWRVVSLSTAFWYTTAVHVAHNLLGLILFLFARFMGS
jgi:hypothetical protein